MTSISLCLYMMLQYLIILSQPLDLSLSYNGISTVGKCLEK